MSSSIIARRKICGVYAVYLISAVSAWPHGAAVAQESARGSGDAKAASAADDQTVVITGSRAPEALNNTLWSTTVLTREDIEARQASSLQELLADVAGIDVVNNGGLGKVSTVLMRGAEADHTLLLVDGVRVASATAGTAPFELIPLSQIDHIEVVRGPRSTLYGTDAIGGVIQIFTRRPPPSGAGFGGSIGSGSHDTRDVTAQAQAGGERVWINASAEYFDTDGINSCDPGALAAFAGCFASEPDLDGYRNGSGALSMGYRLNGNWSAGLRSLYATGRTEFDGSFGNSTDFSEQVVALSLDGSLGAGWRTLAQLGRNVDNQHNFADGAPAGTFDTTRDTASVQLDRAWSRGLRLISGVEYQKDKVDGDTAYIRSSRSSRGVFGELHGDWGGWSALAGARYEDNQQYGSHVAGNAGVARKLDGRHRLTATWGTAFHAPSFNDLYYPFGFGNPSLEPEESRSLELGVDGVESLAAPLHWSLHAFQTDIDQLIGFDPVLFIPVNIAKSRIRGAELQADWRDKDWKLGGQLAWLDPRNRSANDLLLPRRARQSGSFEVRRFWPSLSIAANARYEGARYDDLANALRMGGFFTLDLAVELRMSRSLTLQGRVANLLDRDYTTAAFYLQDGRHYSMTLRYLFDADRK